MKLYKIVINTKPEGAIEEATVQETKYVAALSLKAVGDKFPQALKIELLTIELINLK
jgi:hypothetical protein